MPEIHVHGGRLYSSDGSGILVKTDQLGMISESDGVAFTMAGTGSDGELTTISLTADNRLRVDAGPDRNLFATSSAWGASPWSSKSAW